MKASVWPHRRWVRVLLARASLFWLGVRGLSAWVLYQSGLSPVRLAWPQAGWLAVAVAVLVWWETRRKGELLLLANLGHGHAPVLLLGLGPPLVMEVVLGLGTRL